MRLRKLSLKTDEDWKRELQFIGADSRTWDRLAMKCRVLAFSTGYLPSTAANILKQCMLSGGADAIVSRGTVSSSVEDTDAMVVGTARQILRGCTSLEGQPFELDSLANDLREAVLSAERMPPSIDAGRKRLDFSRVPLIMGILNVTPDSFSDGGIFLKTGDAVRQARLLVEQGADIIDIGAESTRPGSGPVPPEVQLGRIIPVLNEIATDCSAVISIDTTSSLVAGEALKAGGDMINDVSSLSDMDMAAVIAGNDTPVVLMHMKGTPENMQDDPRYDDVLEEVYNFLEERISMAESCGISRQAIIIDPGIGFGKRLQDNLQLISRLEELRWLGCRVLLGHSRKTFLGQISGLMDPEAREIVSHAVTALSSGSVDIVRVHDVKNTVDVLKVAGAIDKGSV